LRVGLENRLMETGTGVFIAVRRYWCFHYFGCHLGVGVQVHTYTCVGATANEAVVKCNSCP
jgi:hypothetical protein